MMFPPNKKIKKIFVVTLINLSSWLVKKGFNKRVRVYKVVDK